MALHGLKAIGGFRMVCASKDGFALIRRWEGRRLSAYRDPAGIWTIGYGHTGAEALPGHRISAARAEALLAEDAARIATGISPLIDAELTQSMADALISFAYNIGVGAFSRSTVRRALNAGQPMDAAAAMLWWTKTTIQGRKTALPGLIRRRIAEAELFLSTGD